LIKTLIYFFIIECLIHTESFTFLYNLNLKFSAINECYHLYSTYLIECILFDVNAMHSKNYFMVIFINYIKSSNIDKLLCAFIFISFYEDIS
jgi:hypothetical protein